MPSPPVKGPRGRPGRPRQRPAKLHLDKGYDYPRCRRTLRRRGITPRIARRGIEPSDRLGRHRYVAERSLEGVVEAGVFVSKELAHALGPDYCDLGHQRAHARLAAR
jgi:IS5 family transposase